MSGAGQAQSHSSNQPLVVSVRANPEPNDVITFTNTECAIAGADPGGANGPRGVDLLEPEAGVIRIVPENPIGFSGLTLDMLRELCKRPAERFSSVGVHKRFGSSL